MILQMQPKILLHLYVIFQDKHHTHTDIYIYCLIAELYISFHHKLPQAGVILINTGQTYSLHLFLLKTVHETLFQKEARLRKVKSE